MSWLLLVAAYGIGAIPTSHLAGRLRSVDLRQHGSGNLGATNAFRVLGWRLALPVMLLDVAKGWIPTALFPGLAGTTALGWALAYGLLAVVGHVFSVFVGFRGGKGVATGAGVFLALSPWAVLIVALVWGVTVVMTRIVSIGSILAALLLPLAVFATTSDISIFWLSVALSLFVIHAHRANIRRLVRGEENRLGRTPESAR